MLQDCGPRHAPEPIAIVGMGCRLPGGANDPDSFWSLLTGGVDAIRDVPADRWNVAEFYDSRPATIGKTNSRWGGFIDGIDLFDAQFFGISPREAAYMDPQQRLLMEVAAEALADAGLPMERIAGTTAGVYVGISSYDYAVIQQGNGDVFAIDAHSNTGSALSIAANRLSYFFNLSGPSLIVDTACSSSLVAVELACQSLWRKESPLAIAGGVNVVIKPEPFIGFSRLNMLSPDGRCKSFDAAGNGFVRAEGAGIVVLKPLGQAIADGDRIYAVIRSAAVNQDGHSSSMVVPRRESQEQLLVRACETAGIAPADVDFVEAHGTGTPVGDPIEAEALGNVYSQGRAENLPCVIGSVKSNIGHLEPASGIAGLIKAAMAVYHRQIPATLHLKQPNPTIPFERLKLRVATTLESWPQSDRKAIAGVNSFGFGGTNAHILLEEPTRIESRHSGASPASRPSLIPLSGASPEALKAVAQSFVDWIRTDDGRGTISLADVAHTAAHRRSHYEQRLTVVADSLTDLANQLEAFLTSASTPFVAQGRPVAKTGPGIAFVCSGQGPQWWKMGRELFAREPVFADVIRECDALIQSHGPAWSLLEQMTVDESSSRIDETSVAQPAIFALQVALARLWQSWGVEPTALIGHSVGEVAAAHLAGALSLADAVAVIYHRGRCMDLAPAEGRMLAVAMSVADAQDIVRQSNGRVFLAAVNSPSAITLSGEPEPLAAIAERLEREGRFHRFLRVNYAFHSAQMDPIREELLESLQHIQPRDTTLPLISTVTHQLIDGRELTADYWWRNVRQTVWFAAGAEQLLQRGYTTFVELSPHPVLRSSLQESAPSGQKIHVSASLRRDQDEQKSMLHGLGELSTLGYPIAWSAVLSPGRFIKLPAYPWQHERFWKESVESRQSRLGTDVHPLLGHRLSVAMPVWEKRLELGIERWLNDHQVQGRVVFPAAGYLEMALSAAQQVLGPEPCLIEHVEFTKACVLEEGQHATLQLAAQPAEATWRISSRPERAEQAWREHAHGHFRRLETTGTATNVDLDRIRARCRTIVTKEDSYQALRDEELHYGPAFQGIDQIQMGDSEVLSRIVAPAEIRDGFERYLLHPALLDACLHAAVLELQSKKKHGDSSGALLPVEVEQIRWHRRPTPSVWSHAVIRERSRASVVMDIVLCDDAGAVIAEIVGLKSRALDSSDKSALDDMIYRSGWKLLPLDEHAVWPPLAIDIPQLTAALTDHAATLETRMGMAAYNLRFEQAANRLCSAYLCEAFAKLGCDWQIGHTFSLTHAIEAEKILPRFERSVRRYLRILEDEALLQPDGEHWTVRRLPDGPAARELWCDTVAEFPAAMAELRILDRCGWRLADILGGRFDPMEILFPGGSLDELEQIYQDGPTMRQRSLLGAETVARFCQEFEEGRPIRILEIGAGTGGLTSYILPRLVPERTQYVFTDVSNHFLNKAREKFVDYPFVEYRCLDIEQDSTDENAPLEQFDLIIAAEVLHATADLSVTMRHVRQRLAPGGLLVLLEGVRPNRWIDVVFGLTEGWWRFTDLDRRGEHPLLSRDKWQQLLAESGFVDVAPIVFPVAGHEPLNCVLLASVRETEAPAEPLIAPALRNAHGSAGASPSHLPTTVGNWLIFADHKGRGEQLAAELIDRGGAATLVFSGTAFEQQDAGRYTISVAEIEAYQRLFRAVMPHGSTLAGVVHLWNHDLVEPDAAGHGMDDLRQRGSLSVIRIVQALSQLETPELPRLWIVTAGAMAVGAAADPVRISQGPAWGLKRVIATEMPKLRTSVVDLSAEAQPLELEALANEILANGTEDELALRGRARYAHRMQRGPLTASNTARKSSSAFRLETSRRGMLDKLALRTVERRALRPGDVEIQVVAAGLNFSDVMKALGIYPGLPDGPVPLGIECAGRISAVGSDVTDFRVGDEVMAIAPFSLASHVVTSALLVARKPSHLSFDEAATIPVTFLTAHYALNHLGHMEPGERVLIHAATGGVGLAAIQLADRAGATVFATAGTPQKRELLQRVGVEHVMDSRTLAFVEQTLAATGGQGVDLVLNSLAGEALQQSFHLLRDYGRFLEIGKRDIYQNSRLNMRPFQRNLSFLAIDLDRALRQRPEGLSRLFRELAEMFERRELSPLMHRVFPVSNVIAAYRYMAKARHLGKIVVSLEDPALQVGPPSERLIQFHDDATYLVTGGCGGFGLSVAKWLAERGARHLVLVGRRGAASEEAQQRIAELRASGVDVRVPTVDISDRAQVAAMMADIRRDLPTLRGVFHAAMVLDDCLLFRMEDEHLRAAWGPKVAGAWHLHHETLGLPLDHFVLFSSMASMFGSGGQANYVTANAFLESLAWNRHQQGLPALAVNWGYLGGVGFVARNKSVGERFEAMGVKSFSAQQALDLLGQFLKQGEVQAGVIRIDWRRFKQLLTDVQMPPRFWQLAEEFGQDTTAAASGSSVALRSQLLAANPQERESLLLAAVSQQVARVLGMAVDRLDLDQPITSLGLDSLMAVELRNWVEADLRLSLPTVELLQGPSVKKLVDILNRQLSAPDAPPAEPVAVPVVGSNGVAETNGVPHEMTEELVNRVDEMSDADVDALLQQMEGALPTSLREEGST